MNQSRLIVSRDLGEFFRQEVSEAKDSLGIKLSDNAEFYIVNLLCDFSRREAAPSLGDEPLALLYKKALEATPAERVQLLKNLGDVALYIAGFFGEFIERSLVDVDYYISMGGNAYGNLSSLVGGQRHGATFAELYLQLAKRFTEIVDLLNQISERARSENNGDLLKLYNRWARTGSQRIHKLLVERGLLPAEGIPTDYVQ
jgi:hypothetical protein